MLYFYVCVLVFFVNLHGDLALWVGTVGKKWQKALLTICSASSLMNLYIQEKCRLCRTVMPLFFPMSQV